MWKNLHIPTDLRAFTTQLRPTNPGVGADSTRNLYILSQKECTCTFVFLKQYCERQEAKQQTFAMKSLGFWWKHLPWADTATCDGNSGPRDKMLNRGPGYCRGSGGRRLERGVGGLKILKVSSFQRSLS